MTTRVKISLGYTVNMQNFESLRVDVGVEDDVRDGETVTAAYDRTRSFVEKKLLDTVNEVRKELKEES